MALGGGDTEMVVRRTETDINWQYLCFGGDAVQGEGRGNQRRLPGGSYINLESLGPRGSQAKRREMVQVWAASREGGSAVTGAGARS